MNRKLDANVDRKFGVNVNRKFGVNLNRKLDANVNRKFDQDLLHWKLPCLYECPASWQMFNQNKYKSGSKYNVDKYLKI